jgi:hypothetical protein
VWRPVRGKNSQKYSLVVYLHKNILGHRLLRICGQAAIPPPPPPPPPPPWNNVWGWGTRWVEGRVSAPPGPPGPPGAPVSEYRASMHAHVNVRGGYLHMNAERILEYECEERSITHVNARERQSTVTGACVCVYTCTCMRACTHGGTHARVRKHVHHARVRACVCVHHARVRACVCVRACACMTHTHPSLAPHTHTSHAHTHSSHTPLSRTPHTHPSHALLTRTPHTHPAGRAGRN